MQDFSFVNFRELWRNSRSKKYMSDMEIEQVKVALEDKNERLLSKLFEILQQEHLSNEKIVQDFVMTKNRILDELLIESTELKKKYIDIPEKNKRQTAETKEKSQADTLLNQL